MQKPDRCTVLPLLFGNWASVARPQLTQDVPKLSACGCYTFHETFPAHRPRACFLGFFQHAFVFCFL